MKRRVEAMRQQLGLAAECEWVLMGNLLLRYESCRAPLGSIPNPVTCYA